MPVVERQGGVPFDVCLALSLFLFAEVFQGGSQLAGAIYAARSRIMRRLQDAAKIDDLQEQELSP